MTDLPRPAHLSDVRRPGARIRCLHVVRQARPGSPWRWCRASLAALTLTLMAVITAVAPASATPPEPPTVRDKGTLRIGSKRFTEGYIIAQLVAEKAEPHVQVDLRSGLGNSAIVFAALRSGSIDVYPDYLGTLVREVFKLDHESDVDEIRRKLAVLGLGLDVRFGFNNGYALAVREDVAQRLGLHTISDLARHADLRLALSEEFIGRSDGWIGLSRRYQLKHKPTSITHQLAYQALESGTVEAIDVYTTDARIVTSGVRLLQDDQGFFPRYDAWLVYRLDVPSRFPQAWAAIRGLEGRIDDARMMHMNAMAEFERVPFDRIARQFLAAQAADDASRAATQGRGGPAGVDSQAGHSQQGSQAQGAAGTQPAAAPDDTGAAKGTDPDAGLVSHVIARLFAPDVLRLLWQHTWLVVVSVLAATAIGIPLGVIAARRPAWRQVILSFTGLMQTIPSLALLALLVGMIGTIGAWPTLIALTMYSLLPIARNTCTALLEGSAGLRAAATALGLRRFDVLRHVELPIALPVVLAGVRTATVTAIGTATIAAFVGAGGFGTRIVTGLALNDRAMLLAGAIPAALMALCAEALLGRIERFIAHRRGRQA